MEKHSRPMRTTRSVQALAQAPRLPWYRITNKADGPVQVHIYDEIGGPFGVSASDFMAEMSALSGNVELHLNSPGGDVFDGIAIYNTLKQRSGTVAVVVDGLAASAASFIAMAASPGQLKMAPHSQVMIHDGFGAALGNAADMRQMADLLDKASDNIAGIYAARTGKPADFWRALMRAETWYTDSEAVGAGLADSILGQESSPADWDLSVYNGPVRVICDRGHPVRPDGSHTREKDAQVCNAEKYSADDRKQMASDGRAMPDGSYPINDEEDLGKAVKAVGRGGADHDAIRRHVMKRAKALGKTSVIPESWNADGSLDDGDDDGSGTSNKIDPGLLASAFLTALEGGKAA